MPGRRRAARLALALLALAARPAAATFHAARIAEINARGGGAATVQYVEIEMEGADQNAVKHSVLAAFDCDGDFLDELLLVPADVPVPGAGVRWLMASVTPVGGITPDFDGATPGIPTDCGQVCWGAPGTSVPPPASWDHAIPENYVDCVAYGGYTGPTVDASGTPTSLVPGDGVFALTRIADTGDNASDFALLCPTPENDAGDVGGFGPCTETTTTTVVSTTVATTPSSTSTTATSSTSPSTSPSTSSSSTTEPPGTTVTSSTSTTSSTSGAPTTSTTTSSTASTTSSTTSSTTTSSTTTSSVPASTTSTSTAPTTSSSTTTSSSNTTTSTSAPPATSTTTTSTTSSTKTTTTTTSTTSSTKTTRSTTTTTAPTTTTITSSTTTSLPGTTVTTTSTATSSLPSTTATTSTSSTTTLPAPTADRLPGKKMELRARKLLIASRKDPAAAPTLGRGPGSPDDPTLNGARLIVVSAGDAGDFTTVYPLEASTGTWRTRRRKGAVVGYVFKGRGAVRGVAIEAERTLVVRGKGAELGHDLEGNPNPVHVRLEAGAHAWCLEFGGDTNFKEDTFFKAKNAPPPAACVP